MEGTTTEGSELPLALRTASDAEDWLSVASAAPTATDFLGRDEA